FPTTLSPAKLEEHCPGNTRVTRVRFLAFFKTRPEEVHHVTDVQVEVTDGRGLKTVYDDRWIQWR
ncbi:MAG TPA: hypothetical protein VJZ00_01120, partial [Thermoanaerobaculia bacterium]|nr:hypothetical protein [Thermoanaerobaculia bacterium]